MKEYTLEIKPAIYPEDRHHIEDCLDELGYHVSGGGTRTDGTSCDISFRGGKDETQK